MHLWDRVMLSRFFTWMTFSRTCLGVSLFLLFFFCSSIWSFPVYAGDQKLAKTNVGAKRYRTRVENFQELSETYSPSRSEGIWAVRGKHNKFTVLAEAGATMAVFAYVGHGVNIGGFIDRDKMVDLSYFNAKFSGQASRQSISLLSSRLRWVLGDSFNLGLGAGVRQLQFGKSAEIDHRGVIYRGTGSSALIGGTLGNRWQWGHTSFGCDWLGVDLPVYSWGIRGSQIDELSVQNDAVNQAISDEVARYVKKINLSLFKVQFGWSF